MSRPASLREIRTAFREAVAMFGGCRPPSDEHEALDVWEADRARTIEVGKQVVEIVRAWRKSVPKTDYDVALSLLADLVSALPEERTKEAREWLKHARPR